MTKADDYRTKVHYKGSSEDFIVFIESVENLQKWKSDKTVPLIDVVDSFDVFLTHKHGAQGQLDRASKAALENEFGSSKDDVVVQQILEKGDAQESKGHGKSGDRNPTNGPGVASMTGSGVHN